MHFQNDLMSDCSRSGDQSFRAVILISAYGKSPFLELQIESIASQMACNDLLVVVDDGSRTVDWTPFLNLDINYCIWNRLKGMGSTRSYLDLLIDQDYKAQYYFLADQDDVWMPGKMSTQINKCSNRYPQDILLCMHGWQNFRECPGGNNLEPVSPVPMLSREHYCFETPAPGMTLCITAKGRSVLNESRALFSDYYECLPHDRIICAVLSRFELIAVCPEVLVRYRQHSNNQIGAPEKNKIFEWFRRLSNVNRATQAIRQGAHFAYALYGMSGQSLSQYKRQLFGKKLRKDWLDDLLVRAIILTAR